MNNDEKASMHTVDIDSMKALQVKGEQERKSNPVFLEAETIYQALKPKHGDVADVRLRELAQEEAEAHQRAQDAKKKLEEINQDNAKNLEELLRLKGEAETIKYKGAHVNDQATKVIYPKVEPREVADMLESVTTWRAIMVGRPKGASGDSPNSAFDKIPVYYFDPKTGLYESSVKAVERLMLAVDNRLTDRSRKDIYAWLRIDAPNLNYDRDPDYVAFNNRLYDMHQRKLVHYSPDHPILSKLPFDFKEDATTEPEFGKGEKRWKLSTWIEELATNEKGELDPNKQRLIWSILACALHLASPDELAFWLIDDGHGRSGKGTFQALVRNLAGVDNVASLKIAEFGQRFRSVALTKPVVIGDDNPPTYIEDNSVFRAAVTHDEVFIETKGKQGYSIYPHSLIIESMNNFPKFKDTTFANLRRQRIIKFEHEYTESEANPAIKNEYINDPRLLQWLALEIITKEQKGEISVKNIPNTHESDALLEDMQRDNDPVFNFVSLLLNGQINSTVFSVDALYCIFLDWNETTEHVKVSMRPRRFTTELKQSATKLGWCFLSKNIPAKLLPLDHMDVTDFDGLSLNARAIYTSFSKATLSSRNKSIIYKP